MSQKVFIRKSVVTRFLSHKGYYEAKRYGHYHIYQHVSKPIKIWFPSLARGFNRKQVVNILLESKDFSLRQANQFYCELEKFPYQA